MRILFILEYYYPHVGGVETLFKSLIDRLDQNGHHVTVLTNKYDSSLLASEDLGNNIKIIRKRFYNRYIFTFFAWIPAIGLARKADIIHTTSYNASIPARIAAFLTGTKAVITFHEYWGDLWMTFPWMTTFSKRLHQLFEKMIGRLKFDRFVAVSDYTATSMRNAGVNKKIIQRIYNGLDTDELPKHQGSKSDQPFTFLFFGRAGVAKGLDILLKGYALLLNENTNHRLILVLPSETTPFLTKVKSLLVSLKLENRVEVLHDLNFDDLANHIAASDAVVIPSYSEGFCFAAVETMAIGTPIISSGRGALGEVVGGKNIVMQAQNEQAMYESMKEAIDGKWNITEIKKFPLSETIDQYMSLYEEL